MGFFCHFEPAMNDSKSFSWPSKVHFNEADPAGWMFFAVAFAKAHACLEDFLRELGLFDSWFTACDYSVPIRAAQSDYKSPLRVGESFTVRLSVVHLGESSVSFRSDFYSGDRLCVELKTIHVFMDAKSQLKRPIPPAIREKLVNYLKPV